MAEAGVLLVNNLATHLAERAHDESNAVPQAKWLCWKKTRDDVFGFDVEPWSESWALRLIFEEGASEKQNYLWTWNKYAKDSRKN